MINKKLVQSVRSLTSTATAAAIAALPEPSHIHARVPVNQAVFPPSHTPHDGLQLSIDEARAIDHANYLIHWRPQSGLPEINQYAIAVEVR